MRAPPLAALLVAGCQVAPTAAWSPREGADLVGTPAPPFDGLRWIQGGPLQLEDLRGRPALVRFWLAGCSWCRATAPALRETHERYGPRGLVVVGIHHPKSRETRDPAAVERAARALGFRFPVATDERWRTVRAWGVGTTFRRFTSVSFLLDGDAVIRWVHDGGEYHRGGGGAHARCNAAFESLVAAVESLLPAAS